MRRERTRHRLHNYPYYTHAGKENQSKNLTVAVPTSPSQFFGSREKREAFVSS